MIHNDNPVTDAILDNGGLYIALGVSIAAVGVSFIGIAPDWITQIGMAGIALIVSLFGVRGWLMMKPSEDGKKMVHKPMGLLLWSIFCVVEVFTLTSFSLMNNNAQAVIAQEKVPDITLDAEYKRLLARSEEKDATAKNKENAVVGLAAGFRSEVDVRQEGIDKANNEAREASQAVTDYVKEWKAETKMAEGSSKGIVINAQKFFTAIPDAVTSADIARQISFYFWVAIFLGAQLTAVLAAEGVVTMYARKREEKNLEAQVQKADEILAEELNKPKTGRTPGVTRSIPKKVVFAWVDALWHEVRTGMSDKIINRTSAMRFLLEKKVPITKLHDEKLYALALNLGVIASTGVVQKTAVEAKKMLDEAQKRKE